jgi:hypothetical protein
LLPVDQQKKTHASAALNTAAGQGIIGGVITSAELANDAHRLCRVARLFLAQHTKTGKIYQMTTKMSQKVIKYTK